MAGSRLELLSAALAITLGLQAVNAASSNVFFTATSSPNEDGGITQTGGITTYINPDGSYRVVKSSDGVPVLLQPNRVAMSDMLISSTSGQVNITTSANPVSSYVTPYSKFLSTGGYFNVSGAVNGSALNATLPAANTTFQLSPSEQYVLVLGNVSTPTNATYKLRTAGTKTLPSGQVVTATLTPGGVAVLGHLESTGSATLDLQAQMQSGNQNGVVDFFLTDQQKAVQLQQNDYAARVTQSPASASGSPSPPVTGQITDLSGGNRDSPPGVGQQPPAPSVAGQQPPASSGGSPSLTTPTPSPTPTPGATSTPTPAANPSPSSTVPPRSICGNTNNRAYFSSQPTVVPPNSGVTVEAGARVSVALNLQNNAGLFVVAYYRALPGSSSGQSITVNAAFKLSSTVSYPSGAAGSTSSLSRIDLGSSPTYDSCGAPVRVVLPPPFSAPPASSVPPPYSSIPPRGTASFQAPSQTQAQSPWSSASAPVRGGFGAGPPPSQGATAQGRPVASPPQGSQTAPARAPPPAPVWSPPPPPTWTPPSTPTWTPPPAPTLTSTPPATRQPPPQPTQPVWQTPPPPVSQATTAGSATSSGYGGYPPPSAPTYTPPATQASRQPPPQVYSPPAAPSG